MKYLKLSILIIFLFSGKAFSQTDGSVSFTVRTLPKTGAQFSPRHVFAMWVEDSQGKLVKNLELDADKRKQYLYTWNARSGGVSSDITSGATLSSHTTHTKVWNCRDKSGSLAADGDYKIVTEFTSEHAQGPLNTLTFSKSADGLSLNPSATSYFTDMSLIFTPASSTGILTEASGNYEFEVFPNPTGSSLNLSFSLDVKQHASISLYSLNMKLAALISDSQFSAGNNTVQWEVPSGIPAGAYVAVIQSERFIALRKVLIVR